MIIKISTLLIIGIIPFLSLVHAEPSISIIMSQTTYSYCEKLFYTIEVSEITGDRAIIHISDESGKDSSAIPIEIAELQNPIQSPFPFEAEIFPLGKYFIGIEYSGAKTTAEFELIESNEICFPATIKQITYDWIFREGEYKIPDGFLLDAIQRNDASSQLIDIPFEINESNKEKINIPEWVKNIAIWWLAEKISDDDFSKAMNNLLERNIIGFPAIMENGI